MGALLDHMEADFKDIEKVLATKHLQLPTLNVLVPDSHLYYVLAIQPEGKIEAKTDFIGHADRTAAVGKFLAFLALAVEKDCDAVISPEYSCPWEVLEKAITQHLLPKMGRIWILGCESITPDKLDQLISAHGNVVWIREEIRPGAGRFLDVLAYITKAKDTSGAEKDVIVLQFKTQAMGGDTFERDHLICGQTIYVWRNPVDNIRLISLICADVLSFDDATMDKWRFDLYPYLIFHPQLTQDPHHVDYRAYRSQLFARNVSERFEVLTLNWARGFTLPDSPPNQYGGSAIYTKSQETETGDSRLQSNHQKGLFYTFWYAHRTDLYFFGFDQHVFHYRIPKTLQNVKAVQGQRTGPDMVSLFNWDTTTGSWKDSTLADDGFDKLCATALPKGCDYCQGKPHTAIDRERLLTLSTGKLQPLRDWHKVQKMDSFIAGEDERSKRLTFTHEQCAPSKEFRRSYLEHYIELQANILTKPDNFPPTIQDLRGDWKLKPPHASDDFRFNLVSPSGGAQGATAMFVGSLSRESAHELKDNLIRAWGQEHTRRLAIWYKDQNGIHHTHSPLPTITDDSEPPKSITGPAAP